MHALGALQLQFHTQDTHDGMRELSPTDLLLTSAWALWQNHMTIHIKKYIYPYNLVI